MAGWHSNETLPVIARRGGRRLVGSKANADRHAVRYSAWARGPCGPSQMRSTLVVFLQLAVGAGRR